MTPEYQSTDAEILTKLADPVRLAALRESGLLNRTIDQRLDHLVFTAARLLVADTARINALDQEQQYTVVGWPPGTAPAERPVEDSACRAVVLTGQPLQIPDTALHPVTCDLGWHDVFRGYLGVPVLYDGHVLGSLCVMTYQPRSWRSYEVVGLEGLARLVGMSLDGTQHD